MQKTHPFDKISHLSLIFEKYCQKTEIEGNFLSLKKGVYKKNPAANIILNGERLITFPSKIRNKTKISTHYFYSMFYWWF